MPLRALNRKLLVIITALIIATLCGRTVTAQTTWYVDDANCPGVGDGSVGNPFCSIQDGIIAASNGDSVEVASGLYFESIDFLGKAITVYSATGNPDDTRIDAMGALHVVAFQSGESTTSVLDGFTITGGNANGAAPDDSGGGIYCDGFAHPTVRDCIIRGNAAASVAGGVYLNFGSNIDLIQCAITGNTAPTAAAFWRFLASTDSSLINCTIAGNTSGSGAVVIDQGSSGFMYVRNCIIWDNTPSGLQPGSLVVTRYTNGQIDHIGPGNISADPWFVDGDGPDNIWGTEDDDLRLRRVSPCVDAGSNDFVPAEITADLNLDPRFYDDTGVADIGDAGAMGPPIVDMGAYERQSMSFVNFTLFPGDSIQAAIDEAISGLDEIVLTPGEYFQTFDFLGKAITVRGATGNPLDAKITGVEGAIHMVQFISGEGPDSVLESVWILDGNATGSFPDDRGGGIYIDGASPTIVNCWLQNNIADNGAGLYMIDSPGTTIIDCEFISNISNGLGGGVYAANSSPTIRGCVFFQNESSGSGGGFYSAGVNASPLLSGCRFITNTASELGGGIYIAGSGGFALIVNCEFNRNLAIGPSSRGGGIYQNISADILNCTFYVNDATTGGDALHLGGTNPTSTLQNSVLWANGVVEIAIDTGTLSIDHCNIQDDLPAGAIDLGGNISVNPRFVDQYGPDGNFYSADGDLRLNRYSPCIDAGNNIGASPNGILTDLDGLPRFFDDTGVANTGEHGGDGGFNIIDMGAYERNAPSVPNIHVSSGDSIQDAIDEAIVGLDEVIVSPGIYTEAIDFDGKAITIRGSTGDPEDVTIDGDGAFHVISCVNGEGPGSVLRDVTVTGGDAPNSEPFPDDTGGGMIIDGASPTITNCIFRVNDARFGGAIAFLNGSTSSVTDCMFKDNDASTAGGALYVEDSSPTVTRCDFVSNGRSITDFGGGAASYGDLAAPVFTQCRFVDNLSQYGGGFYARDLGSPTLASCLFNKNDALASGGGIYLNGDPVAIVTNCTIVNNENAGYWSNIADPARVTNCIIWGNGGDDTVGPGKYSHSIIDGGESGTSILSVDPNFLDPDGPDDIPGTLDDDFRVKYGPAVDSGDDSAQQLPTLDLDGNPRVLDGDFDGTSTVDRGAYEFDRSVDVIVRNLDTGALYDNVEDAVSEAADHEEIQATSLTFLTESHIDLRGQPLTLSSVDHINQASGGLWILAHDAALSSTSAFDMTLNGELRLENNDTADVIAQQFITSVSGELTLRSDAQLFVDAAGGSALSGDATLLSGTTLSFSGDLSNGGDMTLFSGATLNGEDNVTNTGTINALSSNTIATDAVLDNSGAMLLADIVLLAESMVNQPAGSMTVSGELFAPIINAGQLTCIGDTLAVGDYINDGATTVQIGTLNIIGSLTNNGSIVGDVQTTRGESPGTQPGDGLNIAGTFAAGPDSTLQMPDPVWRLTVSGDYDVAVNDNNRYFMSEAELRIAGGTWQFVERMSVDVGNDPSGLDRAQPGHYPIGTLRVTGAGTTADMQDNHDNDGLGQGPCEAVYVSTLIIDAGATLNTNGCPVYYETLVLNGSVDEPANLLLIEDMPLCPADIAGSGGGPDGTVNLFDLLILIENWGTSAAGSDISADGGGDTVVDLFDLLAMLESWGECQ